MGRCLSRSFLSFGSYITQRLLDGRAGICTAVANTTPQAWFTMPYPGAKLEEKCPLSPALQKKQQGTVREYALPTHSGPPHPIPHSFRLWELLSQTNTRTQGQNKQQGRGRVAKLINFAHMTTGFQRDVAQTAVNPMTPHCICVQFTQPTYGDVNQTGD